MNIEAYNLDSLRKLVRDLQKENKELRSLLKNAEIPYSNSEVFNEIPSESKEYDVDQGAATINLKTFRYYDRMYPSQDVANAIGNLIALPLQGQALKSGNSAFVDEYWNAYYTLMR